MPEVRGRPRQATMGNVCRKHESSVLWWYRPLRFHLIGWNVFQGFKRYSKTRLLYGTSCGLSAFFPPSSWKTRVMFHKDGCLQGRYPVDAVPDSCPDKVICLFTFSRSPLTDSGRAMKFIGDSPMYGILETERGGPHDSPSFSALPL